MTPFDRALGVVLGHEGGDSFPGCGRGFYNARNGAGRDGSSLRAAR